MRAIFCISYILALDALLYNLYVAKVVVGQAATNILSTKRSHLCISTLLLEIFAACKFNIIYTNI